MKSFLQLLTESSEPKKPSIFNRTIYRLPTKEELQEVDSCNLTATDIVNGFCYTIIGRGMRSEEKTNTINTSLEMLYSQFPKPEYKKAMELYKGNDNKYEII